MGEILRVYAKLADANAAHRGWFLTGLVLAAFALRLLYLALFVGSDAPPGYDGIGHDGIASGLFVGEPRPVREAAAGVD